MLDKILKKLAGAKDAPESPKEMDPAQVAYAALLVEAARIDEVYTAKEAGLISRLMIKQFNIDEDHAREIRKTAEKAQEEANDIYRFSAVVKNEFTDAEKIELLEDIWEIILSDEDIDEFEEMIVRRLIGLIYISDQDSQKARQRVEARRREQG